MDIFAVTNEYTDLASLKFLSIESGGTLYLYSNTDDSTLPQDMYVIHSRLVLFFLRYYLVYHQKMNPFLVTKKKF